ncbi:hypothetical protein HHI36_001118 [Cryptolaemus montrouzieri]|uniref:Aminopeptidase n=1 Tax=Cryptolaemus montrouzieri TaxID=559131 RepID=A0ABD2P6Q1_9CUCU
MLLKYDLLHFYCLIFILCGFLEKAHNEDLPAKFRLQHNVIPKHYNVKLRPILEEDYFSGEITIVAEVKYSIRNITLNCKNLQIIFLALDNCMSSVSYEIMEQEELLNIFYTDQQYIDPGEHLIYANFTGKLRSDGNGFFKTNFDPTERKLLSVASMFSASNARMVFPCFDDPAYRARFTVRLIKPNETYTALSNMEEIDSFKIDEGIAVDFRTTPPLPPYLMCFIVTKYNYSTLNYRSSDGRNIPLRIFMLDEYMYQAPFLLNVAKKSLEYFEEYTQLVYPSSKLDFIELKNFEHEGMENLGLITLKHNLVSYNRYSDMSKIYHQMIAAQLIVHEISHMWFGDIVTHLWYNDLWLNEGYAELMETKGLNHQYPEWNLIGIEAVPRRGFGYNFDIQPKRVYPIGNFPETHAEVEIQFQDLTYSKGAAILMMLEQAMSPELFEKGTREFLKKHYFKLASTSTFIEVMQKFSPDLNIGRFLETWLYQNRYPMIIVKEDNISNSLILEQRNFYVSSDYKSVFGHKWTIPVTYKSSCTDNMQLRWFDKDANEIQIPRCRAQKWIKFNYGALGYYRVLYTEEQYEQLLHHFGELNGVDQGNLIDETFHLMRKLQVSCKYPLRFIEKLKDSMNLIPVITAITKFERMLIDAKGNIPIQEKLRNYFIRIFKNTYEKLSWRVRRTDDFSTRLMREALLEMMCTELVKYEKCFEDVQNLLKDGEEPHPDVSNIVKEVITREALEGQKNQHLNGIPVEYKFKIHPILPMNVLKDIPKSI